MVEEWTPPPRPPLHLRERVTFDLTYKRTEEPRRFDESGIRGPILDNAIIASDDEQSGDWDSADWDDLSSDASDFDWLIAMFTAAAYEGLHEALEWFQVDGRPFLDPHSPTGQRALEEGVKAFIEAATLSKAAEAALSCD